MAHAHVPRTCTRVYPRVGNSGYGGYGGNILKKMMNSNRKLSILCVTTS